MAKSKKKKKNIKDKTNLKLIIITLSLSLVLIIAFTYAYIINSVRGNEKTFVSMDNIDIEYIDGESINTSNMQLPISSNDVLDSAPNNTFSVKNNNTEDIYLTFKITELPINSDTEIVYEDFNFRYALYYEDNTIVSEGCFENYDSDTKELVLATNIKQNASSTVNYKLYIYIRDNGRDQNHFLNKDISGKIKVESYDKKLPTLSDAILANNPVNETTPDFNTTATTDEGLFKGMDADGDTYYFRGAVEDNYVKIGDIDMLWRIVRINGDGTIRLIGTEYNEEGKSFNINYNEEKYVGYTYDNEVKCTSDNYCDGNIGTDSTIKNYLDNWYTTNLLDYDNLIATTRYCNDTSVINEYGSNVFYGAYNRLYTNKTPQFICPNTEKTYGGEYNLKIGLLSADEAAFAGAVFDTTNNNYYLLKNIAQWLNSPAHYYDNYSNTFSIHGDGSLKAPYNPIKFAVYHVINLKKDVLITLGNGEKSNPYTIKVD